MSEPKTFASLSSGLLARKGAARPAMRPQGFGQTGAGLDDLGWNDMGNDPRPAAAPAPGLSPMRDVASEGFAPAPAAAPAGLAPVSPVHEQQSQIVDRLGAQPDEELELDGLELIDDEDDALDLAEAVAPQPIAPFAHSTVRSNDGAPVPTPSPAPRRAARPRSLPGAKGKAAFTLRLDASRHLKLRLACAVSGRSAQMLVTDALDALLADMPEVDKMAERAPARAAN